MALTESQSPTSQQRVPAVREISAIAIGAVLALILLAVSSRGPRTEFEDLALGAGTSSYFATIGDYKIHCSTLSDADSCIRGFNARGGTRAALWLGNSQVHAVNQLKPGQVTAAAILWKRLQADGLDLLTFSEPNANLQEHFVLFTYLAQSLPLKWLVLPVVFDDLRETGIRARLMPALSDPKTRSVLAESEIGRSILDLNQEVAEGDFAALDQTVQESVETGLNDWLEDHSELWAARPEIRGRLFSNLHHYRNRALGITAQSKRKLIRGRYQMNLSALDAMLEAAKRSGIHTLVYVVPLRNDIDIPYDAGEYERFKVDVAEIAERYGADFANLETTVPGRFWGMKDSTDASGELEFDFMHFQAPGHALLADALGDLIEARMRRDRL